MSLDSRVRSEVAGFRGTVSLYGKDLDTGTVYSIGADLRVRTASTVKIGIMIEAFARVAEGSSAWADRLTLTKETKVPGRES